MAILRIAGGHKLQGEVGVGGAKNAALPIIAGALLANEPVTIKNAPDISDIPTMLEILAAFGVTHHYAENGDLIVDASALHTAEPDYAKASEIRASVLMLGPLLARLGEAKFAEPGGCKLGVRSIDVHLKAFEALGAAIACSNDGRYNITANGLTGGEVVLEEVSLTGTENALMAAVLAKGTTEIHLAAAEPEVVNLAECLNAMGAKISGIGSHILVVEGVEILHGATISVIPDRVQAATYAAAAAITGGEVTIDGYTVHHLDLFTTKLRDAGVSVEILNPQKVRITNSNHLTATNIRTDIYPGFATDMQPLFAALMLAADGQSLIHETMYDGRFKYVEELAKLGAKAEILDPHRLQISGNTPLTGATLTCPDIRGGAGLLLAGLLASGETILKSAELIERGYSQIVEKLSRLGAVISREE
jgi:UDP-N-acetylglucosamine 1-carboxyvinyltransferase